MLRLDFGAGVGSDSGVEPKKKSGVTLGAGGTNSVSPGIACLRC